MRPDSCFEFFWRLAQHSACAACRFFAWFGRSVFSGRAADWPAVQSSLHGGPHLLPTRFKRRATRLKAEAAITPRQAGRIARAAEFWVSRNPAYREHEQGLDVVLVTPGRLPVHVPDALQGMHGHQRNPR